MGPVHLLGILPLERCFSAFFEGGCASFSGADKQGGKSKKGVMWLIGQNSLNVQQKASALFH